MSSGYRQRFLSGHSSTKKYLAKHAESESLLGMEFARRHGQFGQALAIPAQAEGEHLTRCLESVPVGSQGATLIVAVINAACTAEQEVLASNRRSFDAIQQAFGKADRLGPGIQVHEHPVGFLVVLDRSETKPLPRKQGVGLARKIGCDFLLAVMESGAIESPWMHCSDADTKLPARYFDQAQRQSREGDTALVYPFRHGCELENPDTYAMALEYEISLRYYVLGLRFSESPHAFHSMGSALALHGNAYAQVRGFPRREAAEDFYCLNKLAKLGAVRQLKGPPVEPSSRCSSRVPFGTGAAIRKGLQEGPSSRQIYDPRIFNYLKVWQQVVKACQAPFPPGQDLRSTLKRQVELADGVELVRLMKALEASGSLARAEASFRGDESTIARRTRDNLDAFRTLKLVHALRDSGLGQVTVRHAMAEAPFIGLGKAAFRESIHALAARIERIDYGLLEGA